MNKIKVGLMNKARVLRKSDLGYMLNINNEEILLHFNQANRELKENDEIEVFVFFDKMGRFTATLETPFATIDKPGWVRVVNVKSKLGVFVYNNNFKDVLVSLDYLPYDESLWPAIDSYVLCILKVRKTQIIAKLLNKFEIMDHQLEKEELALEEEISARVMKIGSSGIGVVTDKLTYIFIYGKYIRSTYKIGDEVKVKIINKNEEGYNGSLIKNKEFMIDDDAAIIYQYLLAHNKEMPYGNHSTPEEILEAFKMSKKAFKRGLGHLYKERKIDFKEEKTILVE